MAFTSLKTLNGTGVANNSGNAAVIAAPTSGMIRLQKATISVYVVAAGGGGEVSLQNDSGTSYFVADADALGVYNLDFGDEGLAITTAQALNVVVSGAATTQATARCTAVGYLEP